MPVYNELAGFRVLALRASPPALRDGETTTLDALTFVEGEPSPALGYRWSWCPARMATAEGGDCALDEAAFEGMLGLAPGSIHFDLGAEASAQLAYPGDPALYRAACENAAGAPSDGFVVFSCDGGFPISVRAEITHLDQTIRAQKEVRLLFGDLPSNANPALGAVSFVRAGSQGALQPWPEGESAALELGARHGVRVMVGEDSAERFVPAASVVDPEPRERPESLYITWFVSSGSIELDRTSYIAGGFSLEEFGTNEWLLPKPGDEPRNLARLFLVLRDERGGVSWLARDAELVR